MDNNQNIDIENQKHIQEVYLDKALFFLKICIAIFAFDAITYLIPFFYNAIGFGNENAFDFGLIFEAISFVFLLIAIDRLKSNSLQTSKKSIIIAMIPLALLIIYDFIGLLANFGEVAGEVISYYVSIDHYFYFLSPYLVDVTLVVLVLLLFKAYSSINKADGTTTSVDNYTDTFYKKL